MRKSNFLLICSLICFIFFLTSIIFNVFISIILFFIPTLVYGVWAITEYEKEEKREDINEVKST